MGVLIAAIVAGVPARILNQVLDTLKADHPDTLAVRGAGWRLYDGARPQYLPAYIEEVTSQAIDAVFGSTARPAGFCRNPNRPCALKGTQRNSCGGAVGASCGREKPDRFVLFYQESDERNETALVDHFRNSALAVRIPAEYYNRATATAKFISETLRQIPTVSQLSAQNISSTSPSILLPPRNFGRRELRKLVREAVSGRVSKGSIRQFKAAFFRNNAHFEGRSKLAFQPTYPAIAHGIPGLSADPIRALAAHYRAGCSLSDFHWDVYPTAGGKWGDIAIDCREAGATKPATTHVNLLVDDYIRA